MRVPRFLSGRCGQIKKQAHGELSPWTSIHFSSGRSNRGYATLRPPPGSSSGSNLEYRYYPQKAKYHYYDDEHHCDDQQVAVTHCSTSLETHPAPERATSSAEPLYRSRESSSKIKRIKRMTTSIGMSPPRTFSPPSPEIFSLSNERQHEHDQ